MLSPQGLPKAGRCWAHPSRNPNFSLYCFPSPHHGVASAHVPQPRRPDLVKGVQLLDISLRGLHVKRTPAWQRPLVAQFQKLLKETTLGEWFFGSVAKPQVGIRCCPCSFFCWLHEGSEHAPGRSPEGSASLGRWPSLK